MDVGRAHLRGLKAASSFSSGKGRGGRAAMPPSKGWMAARAPLGFSAGRHGSLPEPAFPFGCRDVRIGICVDMGDVKAFLSVHDARSGDAQERRPSMELVRPEYLISSS